MRTSRVLLLRDPQRLLGTGVRARLDAENVLVLAPAAEDVVAAADRSRAALVLLADEDDTEKHCAGLSAAGVRSLVLAAEPDGPRLALLLQAGATGYAVVDDPEGGGLWQAVDTVSDGHAYVPPAMLGGLLHQLVQRERPTVQDSRVDPRFSRLSRREREVLGLLASGADQTSIARTLVISPQTARTHIQNVLGKLEVHSRLEAVALAHEHGQVGRPEGGGA